VEVTPDGGLAIVTTMDGAILIIDIHPGTAFGSVVATVSAEAGARDVETSTDGTLLYATNFEAGTISVYEFVFTPGAANGLGFKTGSPITTTLVGLRLIDVIPVGANPEGIVISPKTQLAVVANSGSNNVSIINVGGFATPTEGTGDVIGKIEDLVAAGVLNQGQGNALIVKLDGAQKKLDKGQTKAAINQLRAFINQVNAFISAGILTPVQGQALIDLANAIINQINGGPAKQDLSDEVASEALPKYFALHQNYPNPFLSGAKSPARGGGNPSTTIAFDIPASAEKGVQVELKIYNILGHSVHTLVDEKKLPGHYTVTWDGAQQNGLKAASGIYILRIKAGEFQQVRKMVLL
jgi:ribosomal protein L14